MNELRIQETRNMYMHFLCLMQIFITQLHTSTAVVTKVYHVDDYVLYMVKTPRS